MNREIQGGRVVQQSGDLSVLAELVIGSLTCLHEVMQLNTELGIFIF